jgi:diguanylate cyclase (GGDEF)-like protein
VLDSSDRIVFASDGRRSLDPENFASGPDDLSALVGVVRGQRHPEPGEFEAISDPATGARQPAGAARFQSFAGAPALVAAVPVAPDDAGPPLSGEPPVVVSVVGLPALLKEIGAKLSLDNLHEITAGSAWSGHALNLLDATGRSIAGLGWTPKQPGATVVQNVVPFLAIASGCFVLLAGFVLRYMRRTAATIAAGEDLLRHQALHDPLSGLPNRTYFGECLADQIEEVRRTGGLAAVLSIDLDRFKDVNDTLGHLVGDALIRAVALRLVHVLRSEDMVARLGGDEFAVISPRITDQSALKQVADRIIETLRAPYQIMGHTLVTGGSIGIALIAPHSGEAADIMRCADVALYRAKNDGRSRACIYDAAMDADLRERKQIENDLRDAIEHNALTLAFQPIVNPSGERTVGVEALCRWNHPERGEIVPSVFVPIAEHSELIVPLGEWVLSEACRQAAAWPDLFIAVNVSPLQFRRPNFVEVVERILTETGFPGSRLELELTESTLIGNVEDAEAAMRRLKSLGVRLALDDFGTGYSSLLYLRTFPFDKLKIDRSFVGNIEGAADAGAIVHAIVSLGRGLGMKVTAEGVETAEQHLFLRAAGVHSLQGYRFGRPADGAAITERLGQEPKIREISKLRAAAG